MANAVLVILLFVNNIVPTTTASQQIFLGGAFNYYLTDSPNGNITANVELITGWVLGKGPCGSNCSKASIGRSTLFTRKTVDKTHQSYHAYYGRFYTDYLQERGNTSSVKIRDLTNEITDNMTEIVLAVSEKGNWEQSLTKFSFQLMPNTLHEDLNFEGDYWRNLSLQYIISEPIKTIDWEIPWHLQTKIRPEERNDTGKRNHCPTTLTRPVYRIKLNEISSIEIPNIDDDGDFIKCYIARKGTIEEDKFVAATRIKGVSISEKCNVTIEALNSTGYMDNTWIAVLITIRDYPTRVIKFGNATYTSSLAMCSTAVQFGVQILEKLETPIFVPPTKETNHEFHLFAGSTWRTKIYAQSSENTDISKFIVTSRTMENFNLTDVQEYHSDKPRVRLTEISWTASSEEDSRHIVCITAIDSTGVESKEQRCFVVIVQPQTFNQGTAVSATKPYFVDAPGIDDFLNCPVDATCVISVFVKSNRTLTSIAVQHSFVDSFTTGSPYQVVHTGEMVFKADLTFQHSTSGHLNICIKAIDFTGQQSDLLCIRSAFYPEDPCYSLPCLNSGRCMMRKDLSGLYDCECYSGYTGRNCEIAPTPCDPNPCVHGLCIDTQKRPYVCFCVDPPDFTSNGYTGTNCETRIDHCSTALCNNRSMCVNGINNHTCDCYPRYDGDNCTKDKCENSTSDTMCIDIDECVSNPCMNGGSCVDGENGYTCICKDDFFGKICETDAKCNFENGSQCVWQNVQLGDDFDWIIYQGATPTDDTGPNVDHTFGNATGHYNFIETSAPRTKDSIAWFQSPPIQSLHQAVCLHFWYNMYGESVGKLAVSVGYNWTLPGSEIWAKTGNQGLDWKFGQATVICNWTFQITFQGVVGDGYTGDIAIDDISFETGPCRPTSNTTPPRSSTTIQPLTTASNVGVGCYGNPCGRGVCYVHLNEYFCDCPSGFEGKNCNIDIDECRSQPCTNGAICLDGVNNYSCHCTTGFTGQNCDTVIDPCAVNPCGEGTCFSHASQFVCVCPTGVFGRHCEQLHAFRQQVYFPSK